MATEQGAGMPPKVATHALKAASMLGALASVPLLPRAMPVVDASHASRSVNAAA